MDWLVSHKWKLIFFFSFCFWTFQSLMRTLSKHERCIKTPSEPSSLLPHVRPTEPQWPILSIVNSTKRDSTQATSYLNNYVWIVVMTFCMKGHELRSKILFFKLNHYFVFILPGLTLHIAFIRRVIRYR